jgi:hypothetical protein
MKRFMTLSLAFVSLSLLSACIYDKHPRHPHDGNFCPPGQAKKGNC